VNEEVPQNRRLFFALWPDADVRRQLAEISHRYCKRPVADAKLHLTLVFLGLRTPEEHQCFCEAAEGVHGEPFELRLDYLGGWPRRGIQWLGSSQRTAALSELVERLEQAFEPCGFQAEKRPFVPHITLSRKTKRPQVKADLDAIQWQVREFALVESVAGQQGAEYRVLQCWPLEGTG
jgi:2'-5' RNA ligase